MFGYYECDKAANDILLTRTYSLTGCTVEGAGLSGGIAGEYKVTYSGAVTIDIDDYSMDSTTQLKTGTFAGGLFGKYTANGSVTITDSDTTNTHFAPPSSSVPFGGIIGEYVNNAYANTLTLTDFTVNDLSCTSTGMVGGVIRTLTGSTYVSVSNVNVTNVTANSATYFGGIISELDNNNAGSFIDVSGNYSLSMATGKTYKGGAIAGSFKKGVIRLAGVTDISGAKAENGYAQLVYENDETLVYAKGSGSDANWTLKRNASTTASDLGQWGEVVRLFNGQNAEAAGIVSVANNKVTVAQGVTTINDTVSFAKCALNMQLNDGSDHGALCFASGGANKTSLLSSNITVSGEIDLSGTGLLGFMRDGGNGCYYNVNNKQDDSIMRGSPDYFTGTITGSNAEIKLAVGESYGSDNTKGGKIYLSHNNGHSAQGLLSFANGAAVSGITVSGSMNVERVDNAGDALHMGAVMGFMTNGAQLTNISVNTQMDFTRSHQNGKIYIGGVAGLFDGAGTGKLIINGASSSVSPKITLHGIQAAYSEDSYDSRNSYTGGVLGLLGGKTTSKYDVEISNAVVSPTIALDTNVANTDYSYIGGMIGRVRSNTTNERSIKLNTVTMTGASVDTKSKSAGGLLGSHWERTNLTVDDLTITGSTVAHKYSGTGSKQSGLVFKGTGKWNINSLSISSSSFTSADTKPASFGLIVNEAYSNDDGLYINLKNSGYTLSGVTVPTFSTDGNYYVDEIAADTKNNDKDGGDITAGGNGTGVININMNTANGTKTKIVDGSNGTGTYQNQLYAQLVNLVANQNSRYYYNLDVMLAKGSNGSDAPGGEQFLLWSVRKYAAGNIKKYFKSNEDMISATDIDLSGLSYYPIAGGEVTMPASATVTFGFDAIRDYEDTSSTADSWKRFPDDVGAPKSSNAQNQHYLMQTGLFTTVSELTANALTLTGDFGYVSGAASGALINKSTSSTVSLTGLTLDKLTPSNANSYLLINYIDGTGDALPSLTVSNLRATNYNATGVTLPVAKSLFGSATGQNMTMNFSDIKLDARDGSTISDTNWTSAAATAMTSEYGTSRSIFKTALFFETLLAAKTSTLEYYYTVDEDWGSGSETRKVTYGKEVTDSREYNSGDGEKKYNIVGNGTRHFTNPISDSNTAFDFTAGFLPYVGNYTDKGNNITYPVTEIKVNYKVAGLVEGCGTYNDPYIISTASQFNLIADVVNNGATPTPIRLPDTIASASSLPFASTWHDSTHGDSLYNLNQNTSKYIKEGTTADSSWTAAFLRNYLASAYYVINADLTGTNSLPSTFEGIGKPGTTVNGSIVFHGVIVGKKSDGSAPTITNPTGNPLIYISNGSVVKNLNINVTGDLTKTQNKVTINGNQQNAVGDYALYGYGRSLGINRYENAVYYGGVIGEIMGGDNIIDDVTVTYSGTTTLSGNYKHLIAEGGMVGAVVNGALIFRGTNSVSGRRVTGGGIYSNQFVGRVINGYAIYEKISTRTKATDVAPDNYNTCVVDEEDESKVTKTYTYSIDTINRSNTNKLDVNWSNSTITVPDAQSLYILSLITQSIASTANTSDNEEYGAYSPSYGYNSYISGVARLGDYSSVGCGTSTAQPDDYTLCAKLDSVNNSYSSADDLLKAPVPYIIYRYTKAYEIENNAIISKNYPARRMTFDNSKFWDITLSTTGDFSSFDSFQAFRGIGCAGINAYRSDNDASKTAMKVATFNGSGKTLKLHISLPRYERNQENYFHKQNISLTQSYSGEDLHYNSAGTKTPYGHDENLNKLMGLGLFDCVMVNNDSTHNYQFQNITLQGTIEDIVYNNSNEDKTGKTDQTQLFCVGGVVGKRIFGNDSNLNFSGIIFDGLTITGAYSCGGLIGIDSIGKQGVKSDSQDNNAKKSMRIDGCNSTANGISITGGYFGYDDNLRHGIGSFVGMTFWCRPYIDGGTSTSDIYVSNISSYYTGTANRCAVAGLIGYSGSGAEIKNINLKGLGTNPVIGASTVANAAGFIGFSQAMSQTGPTTSNYLSESVNIENCTLNNISVKALNNAAGFLARCGNATASWYPKYVKISNCAIIGNSTKKPEIKAYGTGTTSRFGAGGFVADLSINSNTNANSYPSLTSVIENSYIENYLIEGYNAGGVVGGVTTKPIYLRNLYVKNCDINTYSTNAGGIVGYSEQNLSGYNLKIDGVNFGKHDKSNDVITDYTGSSGIIIGGNKSSLVDKFVAICAYHSTESKVPTSVVKTNGTNSGNFFVFADYMNTSATDISNETGYASSFGNTNTDNGTSNATMPLAPYINTAPHMGMGTDEYITGDGASIGKAGEIYKDAKANSSNRRYTVGTTTDPSFASTETNDSTVLAKYINTDGTYTNGTFKISTASAELGTLPTGVDDFAMLVINDDADKTNEITPFIKSYIRLVTNAEKSSNQYKNNKYAYATSGNTEVNNLYQVVIRPCYYSEANGEFVLGTAGSQGLTSSDGLYSFVSANADSEAGNYQFSLIDVQFKDPTDTTQIAYHLYVPVYTKKMLTAEFSAVSMTETKYYRTPYSDKISAELARNKSASDPSLLVESTDAWTTTFIRYTYPKKQITQADTWNYDKSVKLNIDTTNFQALPVGTKFILVDPNANADKYYTYELTSAWSGEHTLNLSDFMDNSDDPAPFSPQNLSDIMADQNASSGNELYEDYYISIYVPMTTGHTHGILVGSGAEMQDSGREHKANIVPKLYSSIVLGDLFAHEITENSFSVESGDGHETWGDNPEMTPANNVLKTQVTATIQIKNADAGAYLASSSVYHAFFISLTSHDADHKVSDIIRGTNQGSIHNTTTYSYTDNQGNHSQELNPAFLGPNYVKLETGNILGALYQNGNTPVVTIHSETTMEFFDVTAFPYNVNSSPKIGTQISVKSSLAYDSKDLLFSSLNDIEEDPDGKFYYSTTKNNAELTFNGSREIDSDAIGYKTNNMSTLGVNGLYEYSNEHSHPLLGVAVYNVDDIIDYDSAKQLQYTVELSKKVTDVNGTRYEKVNNIGDYLSNVKMIDPEVNLSLDLTDQSHYVFTGNISHQHELDSDKMFVTNFSCNVLTGDTQHNEYANYKISITAELLGASNSLKDSYLIYTNAKIDPTVVDEP